MALIYASNYVRFMQTFCMRHPGLNLFLSLQDLQCGSMSLLVQVCEDIEECLYFGDEKLVDKFLSAEGIKLAHVNDLITEGNKSGLLAVHRESKNNIQRVPISPKNRLFVSNIQGLSICHLNIWTLFKP